MKSTTSIRPDWLSKTFAGLILGYLIAMAVSGIFFVLPLGLNPSAVAQLMMWMIAPIWLTVLSLCYLFRSGLSAWCWLGGTTVVLGSIYFLIKWL